MPLPGASLTCMIALTLTFAILNKLCYNTNEMQIQNKKHNLSLVAAFLIGVLSITGLGIHQRSLVAKSEASGFHSPVAPVQRMPDTMLTRTAKRLSQRIKRQSFASPSIQALTLALQKKQELMKHAVTVTFSASEGTTFPTWTVNLSRYPTWLKANFAMNAAEFRVDRERIEEYLSQNPPEEITPPTDTTLSTVAEPEGGSKEPMRVETLGGAKAGYLFETKGVS